MHRPPFASLAAAAALAVLAAAPASADAGPRAVVQLPAGSRPPSTVKVKGAEVVQVWTWEEAAAGRTGYAVFSQTETARGGHVSGRKLYVQLLSGTAAAPKELRLVQDGVTGCELDVVGRFVDGSVSVTDVDGDGVAELTFVYDTGCTGDISPATRKLLVLEGKDKHALRGSSRVDLGGESIGGEYKADGFKKQPALEALAVQRWKDLLGR